MDAETKGARAWTRAARKCLISAFLLFHTGATLIWVMPPCPIRSSCEGVLRYYILPLGMWHYWGMFAPDPMRDTLTLEAEVIDARGLRHFYAFPKLADYSTLGGVPRFRHSKFAANLAIPELQLNRELTARHVVRQVGLGPEALPAVVTLIYQVRTTPPPGGPPADPMTPTTPFEIGKFQVASLEGGNP